MTAAARHRPPPPEQWPMPAVAIGCASIALATLAAVVAVGTSVAPDARASVHASAHVAEPTLPRTGGPLRPIFGVPTVTTGNVVSGSTTWEVPVIATSASRSAPTPVPRVVAPEPATTVAPSASQPVATTTAPTTTAAASTPPTTTAPATTTAAPTPTPTTEPTVTETPEPTVTLPEITETSTTEETP